MESTVQDAPRDGTTIDTTTQASDRSSGRVRAAMIVNPYSSAMTSRREREIVRSLREHMDLDVVRTERSGHAPALASDMVDDGDVDVIVACGGDGTANEVINGMKLASGTAASRPVLAIVPAGGTNVFARALGYPNHPVRATHQLAAEIAERRSRAVNIATMDERLFLFAAGVGLDGEVIKRIDQRRSGRRPSDMAHLSTIVGIFVSQRFALDEVMRVTVDGTGEQLRSSFVMVGNTRPFSYLGRMAFDVMPECTLEEGLDFVAPRRASALLAMRYSMQALGMGRGTRRLVSDESMQLRHDVPGLLVECEEPQPVQADGEYLGDRTHVRFGLLEDAVRIIG